MRSVFFLCLILFSSCCKRDCSEIICLGPTEFAEESRVASEGKYDIWQLEGKDTCVVEGSLEEFQDRIVEDDSLTIAVYHPSRRDLMDSISAICDKLDGFKVVDGSVQLPGFNKVAVAGLTLAQARDKLREELKQEILNIDVFVVFRHRPSHKVEVSGMAVLADIPVDGKTRLFEVIAKAKIPPTANLHASYVLREGQFVKVDMVKLIKNGDMCENIVMQPNDKVYIASPQDSTVVVMGEVKRIGIVPLLNGTMPLREALVMSGGIDNERGDRRRINVIRTQGDCPKVFVMSWCELARHPVEEQLLIPGDVVYVSSTPIANWNRFMEQIAPTLTNLANAEIITRIIR